MPAVLSSSLSSLEPSNTHTAHHMYRETAVLSSSLEPSSTHSTHQRIPIAKKSVIPISMQSNILLKNFSQRWFDVTYGFHGCQRFYRKIQKIRQISPNFSWKERHFRRVAWVNFYCCWKRSLSHDNCLDKFSYPPKIWRNLAIFYLAIKSLTRVKPIGYNKLPLGDVFRQKSGLHTYRDHTLLINMSLQHMHLQHTKNNSVSVQAIAWKQTCAIICGYRVDLRLCLPRDQRRRDI